MTPSSCQDPPTANSRLPSPSMSPRPAAALPNLSPASSTRSAAAASSALWASFMDPSELSNNRYAAPASPAPSAPTNRSGTPSRLTSPAAATEEPNLSPFARSGPSSDRPLSTTAPGFGVPSALRKSRWTAPRSVPPSSRPLEPTARSFTPSRSMSPTSDNDVPNSSPNCIDGPLLVVASMTAVRFAVPSELRNTKNTDPENPDCGAPAARSGTPSRSRSPRKATEWPNLSPMRRDGPLVVDPLISLMSLIVPSAFSSTKCTTPVSSESPHAPTARSCAPLRSMSPTAASEAPNLSSRPAAGPAAVLASMVSTRDVQSGEKKNRCTAPARRTGESCPGAPAARSGTPLRSKSPMPTTDEPNRWPADRATSGPLSLSRTTSLTVLPLPMNTTYASPPCAVSAPTTRSPTPSPSMSPTDTDEPNPKDAPGRPPGQLVPPIVDEFFSVPFEFNKSRWSVPELFAAPSLDLAPATKSGTPSPSMSPTDTSDDPNSASVDRAGACCVFASISTDDFAVPSEFIKNTCTAPRACCLVELGGLSWIAPAAMSGTPSPSMSPAAETDAPKKSADPEDGDILAVPLSVLSEFIKSTCTALSVGAPAAMSCTPSPSMSPTAASE